jgi:hypothetical protein
MRSTPRERAMGSGDRSPGPRCAAAARPVRRLRPPSRASSKGHLANLSHQTPLKSHRHKPRLARIHEPSLTPFSRNPVSRNGLTHKHAARNFAQLPRKTCQQPRRAHKTRPPVPYNPRQVASKCRHSAAGSWGQRLMLCGNGRRIVIAEASEAGLAFGSRQIGAIHGGTGRSRLNRMGHLGAMAA